MARRIGVAVFFTASLHAAIAAATYSIVGADSATREVGGAGTSCLRGSDVYIIYGAVPGVGVIHAQASFNQNGRDRGVELLEQGTAPADIVTAITASSFDGNARVRQYGVADAMGRAAGFTGAGAQAFADDRQGTAGTFSYSVQGNILTSEAVLTQAAAAFEGSGCDLAERLMLALEAGADNGEGDSRCTPDGIPSDSSFIQVERPDTGLGDYLELHVARSGMMSPIPGLRQQFDAWRQTHPCPGSGGGGGGSAGVGGSSGANGGTGGASGSASGGVSGTGGPSGGTGPSSGGSSGAGGSAAGMPSAGSSSAGAAGAPRSDGATAGDSGGCGCRLAASRSAKSTLGSFALLALLLVFRRRT